MFFTKYIGQTMICISCEDCGFYVEQTDVTKCIDKWNSIRMEDITGVKPTTDDGS